MDRPINSDYMEIDEPTEIELVESWLALDRRLEALCVEITNIRLQLNGLKQKMNSHKDHQRKINPWVSKA